VVAEIDQSCSRFRPDSELSRLQQSAGREVRISPVLATALRAALRGARLSDGAVDPTVGTAVKLIGYRDDFDQMAGDGAAIPLVVRPVPGWQRLRFDEARGTVVVPPGVELDLGSTAKALASDLAAAAAHRATGAGVLVSLGGDVAVAGEPPTTGWQIRVAEDSSSPPDAHGETVVIRSGGVATSSTTVRRWTRGGIVLHHIVDPLTGLPAAGRWRTVTVVAGDCLDANIAATAAIVRADRAVPWLTSLGLPSRLVDRRGAVVRTWGWPEPG
jgi:thiamine biosynthesis lipoprotein